MKLILYNIIVLCSVLSVVLGAVPWPPKQLLVDQYIDHFSFKPNTSFTFKQKVLYYDANVFVQNCPIIFYTGNEGPVEGFWNASGFIFEWAQQIRALVVFAEHRYYGSSLPFGADSFKQPNLQYLTIEQALADYAYNMYTIKQGLYNFTGRIVTIGGSYGGMLAAYMRFKYPNFVAGAVASSAPLLWTANEGNRHQFFEDVTKDFYDADFRCPDIVKKAYATIANLSHAGIVGFSVLSKEFRTCEPINSMDDVNQLIQWIRGAFVSLAMFDYPYPSIVPQSLPAWPVNASCSIMLANSDDPLAAVREAVALIYNTTAGQQCYDLYGEFIQCADPTGCGLGNDATAWDFQACTEINLYDDTQPDPSKDMFPYIPFSKTMRDQYCSSKYQVLPNINQVEVIQWGGNILSASNILFTNGDLDPWRGGGILLNLTNVLYAYIYEGGAHAFDLRDTNPKDPVTVTEARKFIISKAAHWLFPFNEDKIQDYQKINYLKAKAMRLIKKLSNNKAASLVNK